MNVISWTAEKQTLIPEIMVSRLRAGHKDVTVLLCSSSRHDPNNGWRVVQPRCRNVVMYHHCNPELSGFQMKNTLKSSWTEWIPWGQQISNVSRLEPLAASFLCSSSICSLQTGLSWLPSCWLGRPVHSDVKQWESTQDSVHNVLV